MIGGVTNPASALGEGTIESGYATFGQVSRNDNLAIECLRYGTGQPATLSSTPSIQTESVEVLNQVRFGRIPKGLPGGGGCSATPTAPTGFGSSGFGFTGTASSTEIGQMFELGRFYHFNRTIERGAAQIDMATHFELTDPVTSITGPFEAQYRIDLEETPDTAGSSDLSSCKYDSPLNKVAYSFGIPNAMCADRITIEQTVPYSYAQFGSTSVTIEVAGFAPVVDGACQFDRLVEGQSTFTAEQSINEMCLYGRIAPASLTFEKHLDGIDDGTFQFQMTEVNQASTDLDPLADTRREFDITTNSGSGSTEAMLVDPGLYRIEELLEGLPSTVKPGDIECRSEGSGQDQEILTVGGVRYVDLDSNDSVVCSITNHYQAPVVTTTTTSTTTTTVPLNTTTTTPGTTTTTTVGTTTTTTVAEGNNTEDTDLVVSDAGATRQGVSSNDNAVPPASTRGASISFTG